MKNIKLFKFRKARAVLAKQGKRYELTILFKGKYYTQNIHSKYTTPEVIDIAAEEVKKFVKNRSLLRRIINQIYGRTNKIQEIGDSSSKGEPKATDISH